ncbi:hypothetical protein AURDEDRAFT_186506 [Auricularia subglabra TFB-10046 SS5]|nr:hypothetical protein AURDEDRAFT_186506 [Auricularia subglabra TFB-10046 SS5]
MSKTIKALKAQNVPTFERGSEDYERSVATPNLLYRFSRPEIVVQPETAAHVQAIVREAKANKIRLTIKCGGHSYAGHSTAFKGISLDLRRMNSVKLDIRRREITFGAGCQWGNVYKALINGEHDGFVVNGGRCPFVGVGGYTLGGGLGPFSRSIGMGSDTLKEAKVVTADGRIITVKESDSPTSDNGRLFWALRGAGGGNFGVVVEMKLSVAKLQSADGRVVAGRYTWFASKDQGDLVEAVADFMPTMNKFHTTDWPERMTIDVTWICDLRQNSGNGVRFTTYFDGSKDEFDAIIDRNVDHAGLKTQLKRRSLPEASTRFLHETLVAQWSEETVRAFPTNRTYSIYSSFVFGNDAATIAKVTALVRAKMIEFRAAFPGERVELLATFIHAGGRMGARAPADTAYFWRGAVYHMYLTLEWEDKWMERDMRGFLGAAKKEFRAHSLQSAAAFISFPDGALPPESYERAYFGDNRAELRRVKEIWDKENFFSWPQGVRLPGDGDKGQDDDETDGGSEGEIDTGNDEDLTDSLAGQQWSYYVSQDILAPGQVLLLGAAKATESPGASLFGPTPYWCWFAERYQYGRIPGSFLWYWLSMGSSILLYIPVYLRIRGNLYVEGWHTWRVTLRGAQLPQRVDGRFNPVQQSRKMLLYPIVYTVLIVPFSVLRWIVNFTRVKHVAAPLYFLFISIFYLGGLANVLLLVFTRPNVLGFSRDRGAQVPGEEPRTARMRG